MALVTVGICAITVVALILGWSLLALSEASRPSRARSPLPKGATPPAPSNTLRVVEREAPRRRRAPVSGQVPRVASDRHAAVR